jgi:hypothetical protein
MRSLVRPRLAVALVSLLSIVLSAAPAHAASPETTVGVIRETSSGQILWLLRNSNTSGGSSIRLIFGTADTDFPVAGDWDGDSKDTVGVVRHPANDGKFLWLLRNSNTSGSAKVRFTYGAAETDFPLVGDWDGDGKDTPGVVRHSGSRLLWLLRNSNTSGSAKVRFYFGTAGSDFPVVGDWNGDGKTTIGVVRPDASGHFLWLLRNSNTTGSAKILFNYGTVGTDLPVVGDWDGNKTTTPGVVRGTAEKLLWLIRNANSSGGSSRRIQYGTSETDFPVVGDWNG